MGKHELIVFRRRRSAKGVIPPLANHVPLRLPLIVDRSKDAVHSFWGVYNPSARMAALATLDVVVFNGGR